MTGLEPHLEVAARPFKYRVYTDRKVSIVDSTTQVQPIELIISGEEKLASPTLPVRWKISPEMIQRLATRGAHEPQMLLVVAQGTREVDRFIVPLTQGMAYLQLRRAGLFDLHATIVWREEGSSKTVKQVLLKKSDEGNFVQSVLEADSAEECRLIDERRTVERQLNGWYSDDGPLTDDERVRLEGAQASLTAQISELSSHPETRLNFYGDVDRVHDSALIRVDVPEGIFAPEPPAWLRWLGDLYPWGGRLRDQCHLRARALVTGLTLPIATVVGAVIVCLLLMIKAALVLWALVLLICGKWGFDRSDYRPLWHFDEYSFKKLYRRSRPSYWIYSDKKSQWGSRYDSTAYTPRHRMFWVVNPAVFIGTFGVLVMVASWLPDTDYSLVRLALTAVLLVAFGGGVIALYDVASSRSEAAKQETVDNTSARQERMTEQLGWLTVGGEARIADLPASPNRTGTAVLLFADLKAKVCKPFQQ